MLDVSAAGSDAMISAFTPRAPVPWWKDYSEILYAPAGVFARNENGSFWRPMVVVTVAVGALLLVGMPVWTPYFESLSNERTQEVLRQHPATNAFQLPGRKATDLKMALIALPIVLPLMMGLVGLVTWVIGKALASSQTVRSAIVVAAFAHIPVVFASMADLAEGFLRGPPAPNDPRIAGWSLGRLISAEAIEQRPLLTLIAQLDVFTIWMTVLLCIGLAVTGKVGPKRAVLAGFIWLGLRYVRTIVEAVST